MSRVAQANSITCLQGDLKVNITIAKDILLPRSTLKRLLAYLCSFNLTEIGDNARIVNLFVVYFENIKKFTKIIQRTDLKQ